MKVEKPVEPNNKWKLILSLLITKLTIKSHLQTISLKNYTVKTLFTIPFD